MSAWSRLVLVGTYTLEAPLRIGNEAGELLLDANNQPMIPGSTMRGALRTYIESALRSMTDTSHNLQQTLSVRGPDNRTIQTVRTVAICCDSVDKRDDDLNYQGCLTTAIVKKWEADPIIRPVLDSALIDCTCHVCRLFGANWIAGRVFVSDLHVVNGALVPVLQTRGGIALSRDRDIKLKGREYQRQIVPAGTRFSFQLVAENTTIEEQGILLLGLRGLINGWISIGADRSHGFGRGRLALDWANSRIMDVTTLLGNPSGDQPFTENDAESRLLELANWLGLTPPPEPEADTEADLDEFDEESDDAPDDL
jgi:CRISPR-associated RAMP protein (TIGR02581 family)